MFLKPSVSWGATVSQDIQVEVVEFHTHFTPGTAVTHSSCSENAAQLAGVNLSTSLSIRLLKPPYTYITLTHTYKKRQRLTSSISKGMREDSARWEGSSMKGEEEEGSANEEEHEKEVGRSDE